MPHEWSKLPRPRADKWGGAFSPNGLRALAFLSSTVLQKLGQLFLLLGVAALGSEMDIYRLGLFISLFALAVPLFSQNVHMSVGRISFDFAEIRERSRFQVSALFAAFFGIGLGGLLTVGLAHKLSLTDPLTLGSLEFRFVIVGAMLIFAANQFFGILLRLFPTSRQFLIFGAITGLGAVVVFVSAVLFGLPPLMAAILGYASSQLLASLFALSANVRLVTRPRLFGLREAYGYSVGTMTFSIVQWVTNYSGRWLAEDALTSSELAAYTIIGQALVALTMLVTSVLESRRAAIMTEFATGRVAAGLKMIDACFRPVVLIISALFISLGLLVLASKTWPLLSFEIEYGWIVFGALFSLAHCISMRTFWISTGLKRTKIFGFAAFAGAAINLCFVLIWGLKIGIIGLLLGSIIGLLFQAALARVLLNSAMR